MMSGGAVAAACAAVRDELFARVQRRLGDRGRPVTGQMRLDGGWVFVGEVPVAPIRQFLEAPIEATCVYHHRPTRPLDARGQGEAHVAFACAAERAVVEVDEELGLVRVLQIAAAQDVGRALHPQHVRGQVEGGTAQGLGLALMEEVQVADGRIRNPSFTDYLIPTILDMPPVASVLVEEPEPGVPYGAKGVGEPSTIVATAAVVAALRDATGRALNRVPVRPDDLAGLMSPVTSSGPPPSPDVPGPEPVPKAHGLAAEQRELL
jgi:CO/xanthine dehydrogenase Mo-binding subunit